MDREKIKKSVKQILARHSIKEAYFFGSFVRGGKFNDVDILINPPKSFSLFDLVSLSQEIESAIKIKSDLVTKNGLDKYIKKNVLADLVRV